MAEEDGADNGSAVVNDGNIGARGRRELVYFLEKIRIQILRAVGEKHHEGHQNNEIREALPFAGHDAEHFAGAGGTMLFPGFRFRHLGANVKREKSWSRASP